MGSIRKPEDVLEAITAKPHIITISPKVAQAMPYHPKTEEFILEAQQKWETFLANR